MLHITDPNFMLIQFDINIYLYIYLQVKYLKIYII